MDITWIRYKRTEEKPTVELAFRGRIMKIYFNKLINIGKFVSIVCFYVLIINRDCVLSINEI